MDTRAAVVGTVALLVVVGLLSGVGTAVAGDDRASSSTAVPEQTAGTDVDPDTVLLNVALGADGTATWTVEYRILLDDGNTTDAFDSVAADIENDPTQFTDRFGDRMRRTAAAAENETGRSMGIENVTVETTRQQLGQEYGVIRYRFTWQNFAAANETTIRAGDAISGFFLDRETQLLFSWPDGYRPVSISPNATERRQGAAVWQGRLDFGPDAPRLVVTNQPRQGGDGPGTDPGSTVGGTSLALLAVVVLLLVGGGLYVARQRGMLGGDGEETAAAETGTAAETATAGATADEASSADGTTATAADGADDGPPEELLTNEERVLKLLEDNGGRIKQQEVAGELDWTDAKTSQVVKSLRGDDEVEVFRLGRENVLSLPDEDDI